MRILGVVFVAVFLTLSLQASALAYLDPGTGSYILMMLISGVVGAAYAVKLYWKRISARLFGRKDDEPTNQPDEEKDDGQS